ncbi:S66 peptidase family protein [Brevibacterium casei]|uniref:LD-carboxypeptidase n=2 Tax=Brevibacterium casei TaxID=33889 RepID=A0A449D8D2_9MICO|nr:LD-carboxypeptidase [Brevibacterium casei]MCT1550649.1 LD-carboxypeptidase [Brevibacterium casei]MCT1559887.1 LD-carboxypeptidase [Brevibacterium casei]MCT2206620.1 LD-carboxypeptidase [Brevibacterium casei]QPR38365.1 LD-carboxypeptidase [Brevibacterium casei]QPR42531.1 LD-carboxypeptidase [Brevibacterium casei]
MRSPYLDTAPLVPGDNVRLIAPSGPADEDSLQRAISRLEAWGLNVVPGEHVRARHPRVSYLAGTDAQRRADLVDAWCDPNTDAVIALRGGYGAMRLIDGLDFDLLRRHRLRADGRPKLLAGSSDVTALHQAWDHHLGLATLFCPMPGNSPFRDSAVVADEVASWLFEPWGGRELGFPDGDRSSDDSRWRSRTLSVDSEPRDRHSASSKRRRHTKERRSEPRDPAPPVSRARTLVPGTAIGRLVGGNLSLVAAGLGSPEFSELRERRAERGPQIAMLEDVDEELYRLDNLLLQLVRAGWFAAADAVVLGSWIDCAPVAELEDLVLDFLRGAGIPIVSELGFGHDPDAPSTPLGVDVRLEAPAGERPRLWVCG